MEKDRPLDQAFLLVFGRLKRYEAVLSKRVKSGKYFVYAGRDQDTENGFIEDLRLSLRYQHYF
jgi:hypothetical protein